jgi:hypothetical protein
VVTTSRNESTTELTRQTPSPHSRAPWRPFEKKKQTIAPSSLLYPIKDNSLTNHTKTNFFVFPFFVQ